MVVSKIAEVSVELENVQPFADVVSQDLHLASLKNLALGFAYVPDTNKLCESFSGGSRRFP
jgi:hypothetical protein